MRAGQDLGEVGEVLRLLFADGVGSDQGKGAGGVVLHRFTAAVSASSSQASR